MIGVEPLQLGSATFQVMFTSALHFKGKFFSLLTPIALGPRHGGECAACAMTITSINAHATCMVRTFIVFFPPVFGLEASTPIPKQQCFAGRAEKELSLRSRRWHKAFYEAGYLASR